MITRFLGFLTAWTWLAVAASLVSGCGSSTKATGTEGGPCYGNGTCNSGLVCLSMVCVNPGGSGGASGHGGAAGGAGTMGAGGTGGAAGSTTDAGMDAAACTGEPNWNTQKVTPACIACFGQFCCSQSMQCAQDVLCYSYCLSGGFTSQCNTNTAFTSLGSCINTMCIGCNYY